MDLLKSVYDIEYNDTSNVIFEYRTSASGKIDLWLRNLSTMIEMKSSGVDLDKPEPRQGEFKTPFKQVYDYAVSFPRNEQPDYLITCNFETFRIYSRKEYGDTDLESKVQEFTVDDLGNKPEYLSFLIDPQNSRLYHEREISETAGQLIGKLYNMLRKQYIDPDTEEAKHSLNVLCVRLVFCLFCEDAGLFGEMDAFYNFLKNVPAENIRINLQRLFRALDTPKESRDPYDTPIKVFPYVNGGLFRDEVEIPNFTEEIKGFLLQELSQSVDWSKISPTIFGGIFESTLNPETRRKGGMHYTTPENIHKVIDPLFLNDLKAEFEAIKNDNDLSVIQKRNRYKKFHHKLCTLTFLDPAAGSGNFLTETYICLRQLEFAVISEMNRGKNIGMFDSAAEGEIQERIKLSQFYGIEINDFAVSVAETALWISRLKANQEAVIVYDLDEKDFPLEERANIICENALRFDWCDLIEPSALSYIMGNPPFVGSSLRTDSQTEDMEVIAFKDQKGWGKVDYCAAWYYMVANYIGNSNIKAAFVSTNSLCQGEQVQPMWQRLFALGFHIDFAWKTFVWNSETVDQAHVHCIIIGFSRVLSSPYFMTDNGRIPADNINGYLIDAPNVFLPTRSKAIDNFHLKMVQGCKAVDGGGFSLTPEERADFINRYPSLEDLIHPYLGSEEFINGKKRYCLWLKDIDSSRYADNPFITERLDIIRNQRLNSPTKEFRDYANKPHLFVQDRQPDSDYLMIPRVSTQRRYYIPIGYLSKNVIVPDSTYVIPNAGLFDFGLITSSIHNAWMRVVAGRLKSDYRYSPVVYNNFAYPVNSDKAIIERTAQGILDARALYPDKSLADLYDPDKMPSELKAAHEANDKAVMDAYGFVYDMTEPEIVAELMKMYQKLTEKQRKDMKNLKSAE
ncbi:MAG: class I SAM-dependent DNA methyltransferase [Clostridia bacterium]|nr:class I SAM-dependent DNA methyltransferase [Clostridia bacterium]